MEVAAALTQFLDTYGLQAVFLIMLLKEIGVPVPIPADIIILSGAARAAQGSVSGSAVFLAILIPMVIGGIVQYALVRGSGRQAIYRVGRYIGLTPARLERAMTAIRRGGVAAVALGLTTPGVRLATVPASGLVNLPVRMFVPGLLAGSAFFLAWHFAIGYLGGAALALLNLPAPVIILLVLAVLVLGAAGWMYVRRRRAAAKGAEAIEPQGAAGTFANWADASCPACIAITLIREGRGSSM
jgi:membrane protein DedA with SNARE-associated domain